MRVGADARRGARSPRATLEALDRLLRAVGRARAGRARCGASTYRSPPGSPRIGEFTEVAHRVGGVDSARGSSRPQRGKQFDPHLADDVRRPRRDPPLRSGRGRHLGRRDRGRTRTRSGAVEETSSMPRCCADRGLHRPEVAVPRSAMREPWPIWPPTPAAQLGMRRGEVRTLRRAGLVHCFGKLGVSNAILDKPSPLSAGERERIRMFPYLTERMLRQSAALAPLGAIAVQHRSVWTAPAIRAGCPALRSRAPRGCWGGRRLPLDARASCPPARARPSRQPPSSVRRSSAGRLDADAVDAVLGAAGHRLAAATAGPAGLTAREIEVLRLARAWTVEQADRRALVISPKTAPTTSSTSTPRSARPRARPPRSSPPNTGSSPTRNPCRCDWRRSGPTASPPCCAGSRRSPRPPARPG